MLQDALLNLAINARDACGEVGKITLHAKCVKYTWLDFIVEDTGPGFSDTALNHAMDPFYTTKGGEGSGLGLTMVYDVTKLAGGRVMLGNTSFGGHVTLRLPWREADTAIAPGLVLLVEDSPDLRDAIRQMLRDMGHTIVEASSVPEAMALIRAVPEISAVLSDISLEGEKTGYDLAQALIEDHRPVYLMTSLPPDHVLHKAAQTQGPVLRKPFSADDLRRFLSTGAAS